MSRKVIVRSIGVILTPYKTAQEMPIQGRFRKGITGRIELYPEYVLGLKDLEEFSHLILIYRFHKLKQEKLIARPFLEDEEHGVFAIRSPWRPNRIGFSIVKLEAVRKNMITFSEVDMLDGTPLLDIKPFVSYFDARKNVKCGWIDKHFQKGKIPVRVHIKKRRNLEE